MGDSFCFPQGFNLDQANDRIFLPKLGWLRYRNSREVIGTVRNITVSNRNGKWFVSLQTPSCGHLCAENRQTQADFACVQCGYSENADLVGAINVLRAGHARLACEENGEVSCQQQQPTERAA